MAGWTTKQKSNIADSSANPPRSKCKKNRLVAFIVENTNIHLKLFGDSTKLAVSEDRPKVSNHHTKKFYHEQVAVAIWDVEDEPERPFFLANKAKYTQAVNSCIDNLHKEYKKHAKTLSQTRIGLDKIEITIDAILEDFPWWHDLNPIWCELPKYNVLTTSNSTADGQELATHLDGILNSLSEKGGAVVEGNSEDNSQLLCCLHISNWIITTTILTPCAVL
ncbi:uncharacterized protein EI90DRAFT_3020319 [Cantharellus anzutake]|uniref:uncharacterized protein n=1 Tax=Cantharellus anzutake TaxID=1750568 RepID=UPI0019085A86|nr:uncharacterized protein EI90DRAFT_3020319 [Cantharellus anzutake]KAF8321435.1 hypothetical protein EI90DRAFT_3020319 [Cantharellus anzutake]